MIIPKTQQTQRAVSKHYDELDALYRRIWGEHIHHGLWVTGKESQLAAVRQLVDVVAAEAEIDADDEVLDVGSGYGAAARQIADDYRARVTALTLSPIQHRTARRARPGASNPTYLLGDWLENDLPSEHFDAVYSIECASHVGSIDRFFEEAVRVLRPGGRLVVCVWTAAEGASPWKVRALLEPICREGRLARLATVTEYVDACERAGAAVTEFRDLTSLVRRTWPLALRRTAAAVTSEPRLLRYLLRPHSEGRIFLISMVRIWMAYRVGAMRYCLLKTHRPS